MSGAPLPIVRCLIACEDIVPDVIDSRKISLLRVVNNIRATHFPCRREHFAVFAVLTSGRGSGELWVEILQEDTDEVIVQSPHTRVDFPDDPLRLNGAIYRFQNLIFPTDGLYWVQLRFDGTVLADLPVMLR